MSTLTASLDGVNFIAEAVDEHDGLVLGEEFEASGTYVVVLDLATARISNISAADSQGVPWMSFAGGWLAWPQGGAGGWSIQLWNAVTHERRQISTAGPSGGSLGDGELAWIEATDQGTGRALHVYQLASEKTASLDSGVLGDPVFAGPDLVWTKVTPGAEQATFVFADAATLAPVTVPAELASVRGISGLAGSAQRLAWSSSSLGHAWYVDDLAVGVVRTYSAPNHDTQFPELADPYLAWRGTDRSSIVDLRSGIGFDIALPGDLQAAGDTIVVERGSMLKGSSRTDIAVLHPSQLSPLGPCTS